MANKKDTGMIIILRLLTTAYKATELWYIA